MQVEFKLNGDIFNKTMDVDIPLHKISKAVKESIESNLKAPKSFDGSGLAPLKDGYYKKKKQKAGKAIFDGFRTGKSKLMNSVISKKISKDEYNVTIDGKNRDIMLYLQIGAGRMAGKRKGFGVNESTMTGIFKNFNTKIKFR